MTAWIAHTPLVAHGGGSSSNTAQHARISLHSKIGLSPSTDRSASAHRSSQITRLSKATRPPDSNISNPTFAYKRTRLVICRLAKLASRIHTEKPMKKIAILVALGALLGTALSGCIVVPGDGGYHHHHDYYR
jgi:hypothetical protein